MKVTELRIGNLVYKASKIIKVDSLDDYGINISNNFEVTEYESLYPYLTGIPLTEEWLLKFGFQACRGGWYIDNDNIANSIYIWKWDEGDFGLRYFKSRFKYVHSLQNLFFCLTGEELIK